MIYGIGLGTSCSIPDGIGGIVQSFKKASKRLSKPLQSRFRKLFLPRYREEKFLDVSEKVLPKLSNLARYIGASVWKNGGDIRDVISIGKLVRKSDRLIYLFEIEGFEEPSRRLIQWTEQYLSNNKADPCHSCETMVTNQVSITNHMKKRG